MDARIKFAVGSLIGGVLVHLIIVGCSNHPFASVQQALADDEHATKTKTADTDKAQLRSGFVSASVEVKKIISGPFVLTDVHVLPNQSGATSTLFTVSGATCPTTIDGDITLFFRDNAFGDYVDGARYIVPNGKSLCALAGINVSWAGFVPY